MNYSNSATLNFAPGVYYIDNQLGLGNDVTVNGNGGVALVIDENYAMSIGNNVTVNIQPLRAGQLPAWPLPAS